MSKRDVNILCTGDIHLGRYPWRVPVGESSLSVRHVWERVVDTAMENDVDIVALTGDVIDRKNRYYEALGPLQQGVRRLRQAGVVVVAVSGNHDYDVLPSAADVAGDKALRLLGRGGRWETVLVEGEHRPVRLVGWSYPDRHVLESPIGTLDLEGDDEAVTVGLLHTDLNRPASRYAPVTAAELGTAPVDLWLLGHVHSARHIDLPGGGVALYPGTPQPLGPESSGSARHVDGDVHVCGPWLIEIGPDVGLRCRPIGLATLVYRDLDIDLDGVEKDAEFRSKVPTRVSEDLRRVADASESVQRVVYRLKYRGRTPLHSRLEELNRELVNDWEHRLGVVTAQIDGFDSKTTPPVDLEALARGDDPPGLLAAALLEIRDGSVEGDARSLWEELKGVVDEVYGANAYAPLQADEETREKPGDSELRRRVLDEGLKLLDALRRQKRGGGS